MTDPPESPTPKPAASKPQGLSWKFFAAMAVAAVVVFLAGRLWRGDPSGDQVAWRASYTVAQGEAETSGKPMLVVFGADWCGPCEQMKAWVFSDATVAETIETGFVPLRVDLTTDDGPDVYLAHQYEVTGIPALVVLDDQGQAIAKASGYHSKAELLSWLDEAKARHGRLSATLSSAATAAAGRGGLQSH